MPTPATASHRPLSLSIAGGPYRGIARAEVRRRLMAMIDLLQLQNNEVSFVLTDDNTIHDLNRVYRHVDRPTDVLAFAMREGEFAELAGAALGDVVVSVEQARKQAEARGVSLLDEVTMLMAHGLLHLLGWDHDTPSKDRRMRAETDRLCQAARPSDRSARREIGVDAPQRRRRPASKGAADRDLSRKVSTRKLRGQRRKSRPTRDVEARPTRKK